MAGDSVFARLGLGGKNPEQLYTIAREKAIAKDFATAQIIARKLLRDAPNYHDARALLGRTYSWQNKFDDARVVLKDLVERAPNYSDGWSALIDVQFWSGHDKEALALANEAVKRFPTDPDLIAHQKKVSDALRAAGKSK